MVGNYRDMQRSKKSQRIIIQELTADLEDLESFFKDLWNFFPLPICYLNPLLIILDVNSALEKFFGYKKTEIIGKEAKIFFRKRTLYKKIFQKVATEKKSLRKEEKVITKKGEKVVKVSVSARWSQKGEIIAYYLAFSDITELKKLQEELEEKVEERTKELRARLRELERFQKITVGRELKMIELKKELQQAREEIERLKREVQSGVAL